MLDPYAAAYEPVWASPLPLAWRFRFGWLYGVVDQVVFEGGSLKAVIEYKSYYNVNKMEITQASLYGLLASLVFATRPKVYVKALKKILEVKDWEIWALKSLRRLRRL